VILVVYGRFVFHRTPFDELNFYGEYL